MSFTLFSAPRLATIKTRWRHDWVSFAQEYLRSAALEAAAKPSVPIT